MNMEFSHISRSIILLQEFWRLDLKSYRWKVWYRALSMTMVWFFLPSLTKVELKSIWLIRNTWHSRMICGYTLGYLRCCTSTNKYYRSSASKNFQNREKVKKSYGNFHKMKDFFLRYKDFTQTNLEMTAGMIEFRIYTIHFWLNNLLNGLTNI